MDFMDDVPLPIAACAACGREEADSLCGRCEVTKYCTPECQRAHWRVHKAVCGLAPLEHPSLSYAGNAAGGATKSQLHLPLGPGLKSLQALSQQMVAEDHWEQQAQPGAASEAARKLPKLHAMVLAEVADQEDLLRLASTLSSIRQQWRAPPECTVVCISVPAEELHDEARKLLDDFKEAIEAPGPRLAYAEGPARAVLCKVHLVPLEFPNCHGKQLRHMLSKVPESDTSWILFTSPGGIWHPARTGLFRNFARQVPGPEHCVATVAPLIVRPIQAVPLLKSAVEVNRRLQLPDGDLEVMEEAKDCVQYCVRRELLAEFLDTWSDTEFTDDTQVMDQLWAFLVNDKQEKCLPIAVKQLYDGAGAGGTPLWVYYAPWQRLRNHG